MNFRKYSVVARLSQARCQKLRMKQYQSDEEYLPKKLIHTARSVFRDASHLVPTGSLLWKSKWQQTVRI